MLPRTEVGEREGEEEVRPTGVGRRDSRRESEVALVGMARRAV